MNYLSWKPSIPFEVMIVISIILIVIVIINKKNVVNRILIIIVLFIFIQRPVIILKGVGDNSKYDIIFVVDKTVSMNAVDVLDDTRLNAAKNSMYKITDSFENAYFTIVTYDMYSEILYPLTREMDIIEGLIKGMDVVNPNYIYNQFLDMSLKTPYKELKRILEFEKRDKNVKRLLFFISDGEVNSKGAEESDFSGKVSRNGNKTLADLIDDGGALDFSDYKSLSKLIDDGAVLGYGTETGGKMLMKGQNYSYVDKDGYLLDGDDVAISKYNEQNLKSLADNIDLEYIHVDDESKIDNVIARIKSKFDQENFIDLYYYFALILLILSVIELYHSRRVA